MHIRLATIEDQDAVVALREALWPEASHDEHVAEVHGIVTGHPRSTLPLVIFVAEHEGALVGFAVPVWLSLGRRRAALRCCCCGG